MCAALLPDDAPASSASRAPPPTTRPTCSRALARHRRRAGSCCSATSTPSSRTPTTGRSRATASKLRRLRRGRHEGRRRARARRRCARSPRGREDFAEVALLLVCDEEWRTAPFAPRRALRRLGRVPVLRGAASARPTATRASSCAARRPARSRSRARGRAAHSGSAPDRGRNALLALAAAAQAVAALPRPRRPRPPDRRADRAARRRRVQRRARPRRARSATCAPTTLDAFDARARRDPAPRSAASTLRRRAGRACGRGWTPRRRPRRCSSARRPRSGAPIAACAAAAPATPATSPPRSRSPSTGSARAAARAHNPDEYVARATSLRQPRAEVALAVVDAALGWRQPGSTSASDSSSRGRSSTISSPLAAARRGPRRRRPS